MNVLNNSSDEVAECPLCMEPLEVDDLNFFPCTCGYQICRFCWHRIRTDENELCPACRKAYPENPADFTPLSQEQIAALKAEKRQRDQQRKQKITENRKHLANVRVVQKNLVFVVGLPPRLADADILKKHEYFGKYGKIHKVVINPSTTYAGVQGPSASAYVTYVHNNDALRAIQSVNNIMIDGRLIKTSLGTTKYCSHFMKNQQCPKTDCMYLHELGDPEASFTKEEMHQGKHQEYEKRLHDTLIAATAAAAAAGNGNSNGGVASTNNSTSGSNKSSDSKLSNGTAGPVQSKEAWPSLSDSPINKESSSKGKGGNNKENHNGNKKHEKTKNGKKNQKLQNNHNNKENGCNNQSTKDNAAATNDMMSKSDKQQLRDKDNKSNHLSVEEELKLIEDIEKDNSSEDNDTNGGKSSDTRSLSSSSSNSSDRTSSLSESTSGKSSPGSFPESTTADTHLENHKNCITSATDLNGITLDSLAAAAKSTNGENNFIDTTACLSKLSLFDDNNSFFSSSSFEPLFKGKTENDSRTSLNNQLNSAISSHLPDLLNGIDGYQNGMTNGTGANEDWEAAFKYILMRNSKQIEDQQEEFLRMQEMQKRNNLLNSIGMSQINGLPDFNTSSDFQNTTDLNRLSQSSTYQQQSRQQNNLPISDHNMIGNNLFGTNMSKFFDFHKNQQQQQHQQNQFIGNGQVNGVGGNDQRDHLSMATLLENNRINSQYLDHSNGLIGQQLQKQRLLNKYDQIGSQNHNISVNQNNNGSNQQPNRIPNQFTQIPSIVDDDLGFDPFIETQKALAELMETEMVPQQNQNGHNKQLLDNVQRTRMPPPGFNHMNAFGFGVPRAQGSKILPFMGMPNSGVNNPQGLQQNNWGQHLGFQQQQQQQLNEQQMHMGQQNQNVGNHSKTGYGNMSDWTAMDPAILSFRHHSSYHSSHPQPQQQPQPQQTHTAPDMFMQHLNQQNAQQSAQGFGGHHGVNNIPNNIMNSQQNSQAQVNYSHSNWLNSEQNQFMNSLTNGYTNNFDKFSFQTPPGIHSNNNLNCFNGNKQKTECIN